MLSLAYQSYMDCKLHSNAHRGDENDHRDSTQLDCHQSHEAKKLHSHEREHKHLRMKKNFLSDRNVGLLKKRHSTYSSGKKQIPIMSKVSKCISYVLKLLTTIHQYFKDKMKNGQLDGRETVQFSLFIHIPKGNWLAGSIRNTIKHNYLKRHHINSLSTTQMHQLGEITNALVH